MARIRARTIYFLACGQCGDGKDVRPFGSLGRRIEWMRAHATDTGHDGFLVYDQDRLMAEDRCPLCQGELAVDPVRPLGADDGGRDWPAVFCAEHGAWGQRDDGELVPLGGG
jgi:hypothetical protein